MLKILLSLITFVAIINSVSVIGKPIFTKIDKSQKEILLFKTDSIISIYRTDRDNIKDIKVSPYNKYISAIEKTGMLIENNRMVKLPQNRLVIISSEGEIVNVLEG